MRIGDALRAQERLREKATKVVEVDSKLQLHLVLVERAMDLADILLVLLQGDIAAKKNRRRSIVREYDRD